MGYTHRPLIGDNFEFGGTIEPVESIATVASDVSFGAITIPVLKRPIKFIFLDVVLSRFANTNALQNYLEASADVYVDNGATMTAYTFPAGAFYGPAALPFYYWNGQRYYGAIDVQNKFTMGSPTNVYIHNAQAHNDFIDMRDLFAVARVVFS